MLLYMASDTQQSRGLRSCGVTLNGIDSDCPEVHVHRTCDYETSGAASRFEALIGVARQEIWPDALWPVVAASTGAVCSALAG
jgi:hypothetical protein